MTIRNLGALLSPRSVALVGASGREGSVGQVVTERLAGGGFAGSVSLVNPKYATLSGRPCVATLGDLEEAPDLVVIVTPPHTVPDLIAQAAAVGARAAVVITAGLSADEKGKMLRAAQPATLRILGPNCLGLQVPPIGLDASFAHSTARPGNVALLSQSGAIVTAMIDWAASEGVGFSVVASLGEMADVDTGDLLDHLAGDPKTKAILMYLEAVTDAKKFMSAARIAARSKPVIVVKAGRSATAARAATSHTGALAGLDAVYDAAFKRAGILRVEDLSDLFGAASVLSRIAPLASDRLAIVTNGGGAGVLAVDALAQSVAQLADLSADTMARLDAALPATWSRANPVDIIGDAGPARYRAALEAVMADKGTDAVLVLNCPTGLSSSTEAARAVAETVQTRGAKPVLAAWLGGEGASSGGRPLREAGVPHYRTPREAVRAFDHIVRHQKAQRQLTRVPPSVHQRAAPDREAALGIVETALAREQSLLNEVDAKALLAAYQIPTVPSTIASSPQDAAMVARTFLDAGGPDGAVVAKILSLDITHKSDVGGVRLNLTTPAEVFDATAAMLQRARELRPDAVIDGVVVQPMVRRANAFEVILGIVDDATFGPVILFGAGGTAVEVVADKALGLPPLDAVLARDLLDATRIGRLMKGYRDRPAVDLGATVDAMIALSHLAADLPQVAELDINPLLVDTDGIVALDARVRLTPAPPVGAGANPRLAIRPYPMGWEREAPVRGGAGTITIRPIRPQDERLYPEFLSRVTMADVRRRFFAAFSNFDHDQIARFTQLDYTRAMAFVALDPADGALLGVARLHADPDHVAAEFAVLVRSDRQGEGIGRALMDHLIAYARDDGLGELYGSVLASNREMLRFCQAFGFSLTPNDEDRSLVTARLPLTAPTSAVARP